MKGKRLIYMKVLSKRSKGGKNLTDEKFIEIVDLYTDSLFKIAYSICKNRQDSEDAVQNAFLKIYKIKKQFDSNEHIKNYLIKVTINNCKRTFISSWNKKVVSLDEFSSDDYYTIDKKDEYYDVYQAVMSLPEKYRIVIHLYYYEDYSVKEISKLISKKETTVQTQLMRARSKLRNILKGVLEDEK